MISTKIKFLSKLLFMIGKIKSIFRKCFCAYVDTVYFEMIFFSYEFIEMGLGRIIEKFKRNNGICGKAFGEKVGLECVEFEYIYE